MVNNFKEKFSKWKVQHVNPSGENLAVFRKYGHKVCAWVSEHHKVLKAVFYLQIEEAEDKDKALQEMKAKLGQDRLSQKNMRLYIEAYNNRKDITPQLAKNLQCDALLIVGSKTSHVAAAEHMHQHMDKVGLKDKRIQGDHEDLQVLLQSREIWHSNQLKMQDVPLLCK